MTFTVGLGRECKLADKALERSFSVVSSEVSVQGAAVSTAVWTLVTLVRRRRPSMHWHCIHIQPPYSLLRLSTVFNVLFLQ